MDKKYYTPNIEDFHIGFKFEIRPASKKEWKELVFAIEHTWCWENKNMNIHLKEHIRLGQLRVKCLDEKDIIECGWVLTDEKNKFFTLKDFNLRYNPETNELQIALVGRYGLNVHFSGKIMNINELQKVMKQLGI